MKKTEVKIITFCDYAMVSRDNKLSIMGIFDQINLTRLPGGVPRAFFVAMILTQPNKKCEFSLEGKLVGKIIFPAIKMETKIGENGYHNIILDLAGIGFPKEGIYSFTLFEDKKEIGSTALTVIQVKQPGQVSYKLPN